MQMSKCCGMHPHPQTVDVPVFGAKMLIDDQIMAWFSIWVPNLVQKCWSTPKLWPKKKFKIAAVRHLGFSKNWFLTNRLPIFHLCTKFGAKMLIGAQIIAQNRNSRWRPSAILDFRKPDFWPIGRLRLLIFHLSTKFGAKMLIDAEIMAKNLN